MRRLPTHTLMKTLLLVAIVAIVGIGFWIFYNQAEEPAETGTPAEEQVGEEFTQAEQEALVASYIEENISELSPTPEVLGGTFMVTALDFTSSTNSGQSSAGSGTVAYEDGHIALVADFEYTIDADGAVEVTLANVREDQP